MSYKTKCDKCSRAFVTFKALEKHLLERHNLASSFAEPVFFINDSDIATIPRGEFLKGDCERYRQWLACVTERLNGAHHPAFKGRWFRVDINETPKEYFEHILKRLNVRVNGIRRASHKRPPIYCTNSIRYSYKIYDIGQLGPILAEQTIVPLKLSAVFVNDVETDDFPDESADVFDPRAAIEAAKKRAFAKTSTRPTARSSIVVNEGVGRQTRELELQWWPNLYKVNFGKLTFRFFVQKTLY